MSLKAEIFSYFFIILGVFELLSNLFVLTRESTDKMAYYSRLLHREIPTALSNEDFIKKAIIMLAFGVCFFIVGIYMRLGQDLFFIPSMIALLFLGIYGIIQGYIYRHNLPSIIASAIYLLPLIFLIL